MKIDGYEYFLSERSDKKLKVKVNGKWIHFGQKNFEHFRDKTGLLDKKLNHEDDIRRFNYRARASKIKDKSGRLTVDDPESANYHAFRILW